MSSAKVVIIGSGPSGIAAATKLLELGFQHVYLLEAENRIGGRVHTVPFADNVVDMGAQWVQGEKGNVVYELASPHNLLEPTGDVLSQFDYIRPNKEKLPPKVDKLLNDLFEGIRESYKNDLVGYNGSVGAYVTDKFCSALKKPEYSEIENEIAKAFFEVEKKIECSSISCDTLDEASGKGLLEYWDSEGDPNLIWKDKGFKTLLRLLMQSDEKGIELGVLDQRVMLDKRVKTIVWNEGEQVKLICEDSDEILADHVICTVSLGVLKAKHGTLFEPSLPVEKIRAIEGLAYGTINKVILEFPSEFWPDDWNGFMLLWQEDELKEIRGTNLAWLEDLFVFETIQYKPRVLLGWMVGPNGRRMEKLPEEEVQNGCMYLLRKFLKWDIPEPLNFLRSTWSSNENFRGSYSYRSMLTEEMKTGAADLGKPLENTAGKPVVLFAGEATNEHHFACVHGAVETGWREAERLANFYAGAIKERQF